MKWCDYGKQLLKDKHEGSDFFMLDDIVFAIVSSVKDGLHYDEICEQVAKKTSICLEDCKENVDAILEYLERDRQVIHNEHGIWSLNPKAPVALSPLRDGIGADPSKLIER